MKSFVPMGVVAMLLAWPAVAASGINGVNGSMPNRLSMNVTVAKQTQGKTFGEKVASGLHAAGGMAASTGTSIDIGCASEACVIAFPDGDGVRAELATLRLTPLGEADRQALRHWGDPHEHVGAQMDGGLAGAGIVSAAVSGIGGMAKPGGAVSSSYAAGRMAATGAPLPTREAGPGRIDVTEPLADGDYELALVVEKATSGLKDTLKTNVRLAAPGRVRIVLGFSVRNGVLKTRHETAKNSISNVR